MGKTQQLKRRQAVEQAERAKALDKYTKHRMQLIWEQEQARKAAIQANPSRAMMTKQLTLYQLDLALKKAEREGEEYGSLLTAFEQERSFIVSMISVLHKHLGMGRKRIERFMAEFQEEREFTIDELDTLNKAKELNDKLGLDINFERPRRLCELEKAMADAKKEL